MIDGLVLLAYFAGLLVIGARFSRQRRGGDDDFFLAGRSMHWFPVGLSIMTTAFNAVNYTGFSGEVFGHGLYVLLCLPVFFMVVLPVTRIIMPFYHRMGICSVYEYLEKRFDGSVRMLAAGLFIVWRIFWMATALYIPSSVMAHLTGWHPIVLTLVAGAAVTAYTAAGGMRAVMWTDVFQCFVLIGGLVFCLLFAVSQIPGGVGAIWRIAAEGSRLSPFYPFDWQIFSFDPHMRISLWSCWIGTMTAFLSRYGVDQTVVQRYFTARSLEQARRGFRLNILVAVASLLLLAAMGLAMYAYAAEHRLLGGIAARPLAYLTAFVNVLPAGTTGLIIAGLFAASMSSVDSGINSCSAVFITDFYSRFGNSEPAAGAYASKAASIVFGMAATVAACGVGRLGSIFEIANKVVNGLGSPLLALFILGMFSRRAGRRAVFWGGVGGILISVYVSFNITDLALHYYAVVNLLGTLGLCYLLSIVENWRSTGPGPAALAWTWTAHRQNARPVCSGPPDRHRGGD